MTQRDDSDWAPESCTLPTAERPLRMAEFDDLFATSLRGLDRLAPGRLRLLLQPDSESRVRDLAAAENSCCSFFAFTIAATSTAVELDVQVPDAYVAVLDGLQRQADRSRRGTPIVEQPLA